MVAIRNLKDKQRQLVERALRKKNDRVIYVHRCFMTFLATLCVGLAGLTFNLHAQLKVSVRMTTKLELKLEKSSSIHNNFDSSFHNEHIYIYPNVTDKSSSKTSTKTKSNTKTSSKAKARPKSKASRKKHEEMHSENEFKCLLLDEFLHYNFSMLSCYQIFYLVDAFDFNILYAQDICKLKSIVQIVIPWHCSRMSSLSFSTVHVAHKESYDINALKQICLHSDINSDLTLTPNEMCLVKEYIYHL